MWDITVAIMCLTFLDHIALWIVVALHLRYAGIHHQYYGCKQLEKGQARDVGDTCLSCVDSISG